jgi:hypothetical protein
LCIVLFCDRLLENLEESLGSRVVLEDILKRVQDVTVSKPTIGKDIKKLFTNVTSRRERLKSDWHKKTEFYYGLGWRNDEVITINFADIPSLTTEFFLVKSEPENIVVGQFINYSVNLNKVSMEVTFNADLTWHLHIFEKTIKPEKLGMREKYKLTKNSILLTMEICRKLVVCKGIPIEGIEEDTSIHDLQN